MAIEGMEKKTVWCYGTLCLWKPIYKKGNSSLT